MPEHSEYIVLTGFAGGRVDPATGRIVDHHIGEIVALDDAAALVELRLGRISPWDRVTPAERHRRPTDHDIKAVASRIWNDLPQDYRW